MNSTTASAAGVVYAGFWRRAGALVLDSLILSFSFYAVIAIIFVAMMFTGAASDLDADNTPALVMGTYLDVVVLYYLVAAMYYSLQESSVHQARPVISNPAVAACKPGLRILPAHSCPASLFGWSWARTVSGLAVAISNRSICRVNVAEKSPCRALLT